MLTARSTDEDRIRGLELGVDDYVKKPIHLQEFLLRVKRALQRSHWLGDAKAVISKELVVGPFRLDSDSLELTCPQGQFNLTALEADLLTEFMQHPNKVLSREYLLEKVWQSKPNIETRTIDNFIMRLRRYLEEDATHPQFLESVRGRGYRLKIETSVSL
jgi:DNA-binding response OmpR family regulator